MAEANSDNAKTIAAYQANVQAYIDATPQEVKGAVKAWIDRALALVPPQGHVLELGSGFGRDADYIEARGYQVDRTDVTPGFVEHLRSQGHEARILNALTDEFGGPYDLVFADAVLLHFTPEQLVHVLRKSAAALHPDGVVAFTVKVGDGPAWRTEKFADARFFYLWREAPLRKQIANAGLDIVEIGEHESTHRPGMHWLHVITRPTAGLDRTP